MREGLSRVLNVVDCFNHSIFEDKNDLSGLGLYGYDHLDYYWVEDKKHTFFIMVDVMPAGFIMASSSPEAREPADYCL
ncbi:MAG: hypothetical protein ACLVML_09325 [Candidatus Gastranaerophilaceae bacterium]|jgi:predicted acetyltransferase